jgi:hypothetical protein
VRHQLNEALPGRHPWFAPAGSTVGSRIPTRGG